MGPVVKVQGILRRHSHEQANTQTLRHCNVGTCHQNRRALTGRVQVVHSDLHGALMSRKPQFFAKLGCFRLLGNLISCVLVYKLVPICRVRRVPFCREPHILVLHLLLESHTFRPARCQEGRLLKSRSSHRQNR